MNCSACGADNREGARFCRSCGAGLQRDEEQPTLQSEETVAREEAAESEPQVAFPELAAPDGSPEEEGPPEEIIPEEAASEGVEPGPELVETVAEEPDTDEGEAEAMADSEPEITQEEDTTGPAGEESDKAAAEQIIIEIGAKASRNRSPLSSQRRCR